MVGVALEEEFRRRREKLTYVPVAFDDVEGVCESVLVQDVSIPNELEGGDQLIECRGGLRSLVHFTVFPSFVPNWVCINKNGEVSVRILYWG